MFFPDISTVDYWAYWTKNKIPNFDLYKFHAFISEKDMYVFRHRKSGRYLMFSLTQIQRLHADGVFKPFVLVTPKPPTQGGVA